MNKIKQAIVDYNNAQRMFNYADNTVDLEIAIKLMDIANETIKTYKKVSPEYLDLQEE